MRRLFVFLVCVSAFLMTVPSSAVADMQLPVFQAGDQWVYSVNLNLEGMAIISGEWTFNVEGELTVSGHEAYNISMDGGGPASVAGFGTGAYTMEGLTFVRKSDLSTIKENVMISISIVIISQEINILAYMNMSYDPPFNQFDFPIKEGDIWTSVSTTTMQLAILSDNPLVPPTITDATGMMSTSLECESKETVEVPAGKFATYKIKTMDAGGNTTYDYISTKSGYLVKSQMYNSTGASMGNLNLKSYMYTAPGAGDGDDLISSIVDYLWLLILLIIVIVVLVVLAAYLSRRSRQEAAPSDVPPSLDEETNK